MRSKQSEKKRIYDLIVGYGIDGLTHQINYTSQMIGEEPYPLHPYFRQNPDQYKIAMRQYRSAKEQLKELEKALFFAKWIQRESSNPAYRNLSFDQLFNLIVT